MAIREIIEIGKRVMQNRETRSREFDFKSYEHDCLMSEAGEIGRIILKIESTLHVPGVESKFDHREDIAYYLDLMRQHEADTDKSYEILKVIEKNVENTLLWAKKLSWLGDWDLNFDGRRTLLTIGFVPAPEISEYKVPGFYFHKGENIEGKNYKVEIKASEADLSAPLWVSFTENWDEIEFSLHENESLLVFRAKAFTWDKSKFAGSVHQRPFYAERMTEYFGKDYIVYYSANY